MSKLSCSRCGTRIFMGTLIGHIKWKHPEVYERFFNNREGQRVG